jgi:hypothetical protein
MEVAYNGPVLPHVEGAQVGGRGKAPSCHDGRGDCILQKVCSREQGWGIAPASAAQNVDNGSPGTVIAPEGVVAAADASGEEQFPPVRSAGESTSSTCIPSRKPQTVRTLSAFVLVSSRHLGAICTVLIELQARGSPAEIFACGVAQRA